MTARLLLVEDDLALRTGLCDSFVGEGYDVTTTADGTEAGELLFGRHFDVVVLDLMLPGRGGLELLRELRAAGVLTPVLILTARGDENDIVLGFELGADDYLAKPFGLRELVARVAALVRRAKVRGGGSETSAPSPPRFRIGAAEVDLEAYRVTVGGRVHALSPKEAAMLALLRADAGKVISRDRFLDQVWGADCFVGHRTVDTHVLNLRHKLEPDPRRPRYLVTVHGAGYRLELGEGEA